MIKKKSIFLAKYRYLLPLITHPESNLVDNLINHLPFEIHAPGYHFCGFCTRLNERIKKGEKGVNPLDNYCREHDIA